METALVASDSTILEASRFRADTGTADSETLFSSLCELIEQTLSAQPEGSEILGIGIGAAGPLNTKTQDISPLNIPHWRRFPIVAKLQERFDFEITLIGDGQAAALAEHRAGAGIGCQNMMGIIVSTGIGGGIIVNDRLLLGPTGNAGHFGHLFVPIPDDEIDPDGASPIPEKYVLERNASGPSTVRRAKRHGLHVNNGEDIAHILNTGTIEEQETARHVLKLSGRAIGQAIIGACSLLELEKVIIAGGFSQVSPLLIQEIQATVQNSYNDFVKAVEVLPSPIVDGAPLIGAAAPVFVPEYLHFRTVD